MFQCSRSCNGGVQHRTAQCVDDFANNLSDSNCQPEERIVTQVCNTQSCPKWEVGDWTPVSQVFHERRSFSLFSGDRMLFILILHLIIYSHNSSFCFHVFFYDYFQLTTSSTTHQSQNKIFRATCNDGHDKERDVVSFFNFMSSRRKQTLTLDFSVSSKMSVNVRSKSTNRGQKFLSENWLFLCQSPLFTCLWIL